MSIPTALRAGAVSLAAACALAPAAAHAKAGHHGLTCGKGHARHSRALGHACARHHGRTTHAQSRDATTGQDGSGQQSRTTGNAAQRCRAERAQLGEQAFDQRYGTNGNGRNAFGRCVSSHSRATGDDQQSTSGSGPTSDSDTSANSDSSSTTQD